jgi:hypothetical protein
MKFFRSVSFSTSRAVLFSSLLIVVAVMAARSFKSNHASTTLPPNNWQATYAQRAIGFELNCGQAPATTDYVARGAGYTLQLGATGARMSLAAPSEKRAAQVAMRLRL